MPPLTLTKHEFMSLSDPYRLLGPFDHTSEDMCACDSRSTLILRESMTPNPLTCGSCFGEVLPEWVHLPHELVQPIAQWRELHRALYALWLDSGEYESWAVSRLSDPSGSVHVRGRELTAQLSTLGTPCYYWWFRADSDIPVAGCPICQAAVSPWPGRSVSFCEICRVII